MTTVEDPGPVVRRLIEERDAVRDTEQRLRALVSAIADDIEAREAIENCRCGREHGPIPPHSDPPGVAARLRAALDGGHNG